MVRRLRRVGFDVCDAGDCSDEWEFRNVLRWTTFPAKDDAKWAPKSLVVVSKHWGKAVMRLQEGKPFCAYASRGVMGRGFRVLLSVRLRLRQASFYCAIDYLGQDPLNRLI